MASEAAKISWLAVPQSTAQGPLQRALCGALTCQQSTECWAFKAQHPVMWALLTRHIWPMEVWGGKADMDQLQLVYWVRGKCLSVSVCEEQKGQQNGSEICIALIKGG